MLARHGSIPQTLYHQKIPVQLLVSLSIGLRLFNNLWYISTNPSKANLPPSYFGFPARVLITAFAELIRQKACLPHVRGGSTRS